MSVKLVNSATAAELGIESNSRAARVTLYDANGVDIVYADKSFPAAAKGVMSTGLNDGTVRAVRTNRIGSLEVGVAQTLLSESYEGAVINPDRWLITNTTMLATQTSVQGMLFNSGAITTASTGYMIQSSRRFMNQAEETLHYKVRARLNKVNNSVMELGFADAATFAGLNTCGFYWQVSAAGTVLPVWTYNSVDQSIGAVDISASLTTSNYYWFEIWVEDDRVVFTCQNSSTGAMISEQTFFLPLASAKFLSNTGLPVQQRLYNTATPPATAPTLIVMESLVEVLDTNFQMPVNHVQALQGKGWASQPFSGAQLCTWANSAEPGSVVGANATASAATLGGKFQFAAVVGAVTDLNIFSYLVPVPSTFVVTGVAIDTWNTGAASATTPTLLIWALAVGSTAVSLATTTANRVPIGSQSIPVGAAIGANVTPINRIFSTPLVCPGGRYIQVILRMPVGTATASQVIAGMVSIEGYSI